MKSTINLLTILFSGLLIISCSTPKSEESKVSEPEKENRMGGLALYTVRDDMGKDPLATLKAVADAGYKFIEAASYDSGRFYGMEPEEFKMKSEELGLTPISTHQGSVTLDNADEMIADVKAAGFKYFVIPVPPMGHFSFDPETRTLNMSDSVELITDILNTIGQKCKEQGIEMLYHNHAFEFEPNSRGIVPMDYFLENIDQEVANFQMDLYWTTAAGKDPVDYFEKYPGRFKIWHVKDMDEEGKFAPVGKGKIDFARILAQKELSGMEYYHVEQDRTFDIAPLEAIKISMEGLKGHGFN
ncbi:MAG: sugar phosphate isomerase/epimerase [Cyclobacteriaceae bacterium]